MTQSLVQAWMISNPISIAPNATLADAGSLMATHDIRHLLVVEDDRCLGVLDKMTLRHARLMAIVDRSVKRQTVGQLVLNKATINEHETMAEAAEKMLQARVSALAVVTKNQQPCGILTQSDMLYQTLLAASPPPEPYEIRLRTGEQVAVRPVLPRDAVGLRALYDNLSTASRTMRFFTSSNPLTARTIRRFTLADYREHMAYVVEMPGKKELVAVAEYVPLVPPEPGSAEFSIAIADAWQGKGLGKRLLQDLLAYARQSGIKKLLGVVHPENTAMLGLIDKLGMPTERSYDDAHYVWLLLDRKLV